MGQGLVARSGSRRAPPLRGARIGSGAHDDRLGHGQHRLRRGRPRLADDYIVITSDPRGISGSTIDDPEQDAAPELVADDMHRVLADVTTEPAWVFCTSGVAVTGLAPVSRPP